MEVKGPALLFDNDEMSYGPGRAPYLLHGDRKGHCFSFDLQCDKVQWVPYRDERPGGAHLELQANRS